MTRWLLLALGIVLAFCVIGGLSLWRRSHDRGELARRASLLRNFGGHPVRMQREQLELLAERDRLDATAASEALDSAKSLVRRDLLAQPQWQEIEREKQALQEREARLEVLKRELKARSTIVGQRQIIRDLERDIAEFSPPAPPGEDG